MLRMRNIVAGLDPGQHFGYAVAEFNYDEYEILESGVIRGDLAKSNTKKNKKVFLNIGWPSCLKFIRDELVDLYLTYNIDTFITADLLGFHEKSTPKTAHAMGRTSGVGMEVAETYGIKYYSFPEATIRAKLGISPRGGNQKERVVKWVEDNFELNTTLGDERDAIAILIGGAKLLV